MTDAFEQSLIDRIAAAKSPLHIVGGGSKQFLYGPPTGDPLSMSTHSGIQDYEPAELVVTARCGTRIADLRTALAESGQMLAADPPDFGGGTLGGAIAVGLAGPGRPWLGALRDAVLGVRLLTGHGQIHDFGGRVMKNVAGYDVARLQVGAHGTLGIVLSASLRVMPLPAAQRTLAFECNGEAALRMVLEWGRRPLPITATSWCDGRLHVRLAGTDEGVRSAASRLGGETADDRLWEEIRDHAAPFFEHRTDVTLWRVSLPVASPHPDIAGEWLVEWGGGLRWCKTSAPADRVRTTVKALGGHAHAFSEPDGFAPLESALCAYHARVKSAFDPHGILNAGRVPGVG